MTKTVVVISIGPVQGFIAAARRMRDFAYGSRLLVELARLTASEIQKKGHKVIFPARPDQDAPNKLVVLWSSQESNSSGIKSDLDSIYKILQDYMVEQLNTVIKVIHGKYDIDKVVDKQGKTISLKLPKDSVDRAKAQVRDILEFYWAYAESATYKDALIEAENALAARKSLRDFKEFPFGTTLPKSSITGHHESILPEDWYDNHLKSLRKYYGVRGKERLSGIDLLKRHGIFNDANGIFPTRFPSTAVMAARTSLQRSSIRTFCNGKWINDVAFDQDWQGLVDSYIQYVSAITDDVDDVKGNTFDSSEYADWFFSSRISDDVLDATQLKLVANEIQRIHKKHNTHPPYPYYAMLLADGDRMGEFISACTDNSNHNSSGNETFLHQEFSTKLSEFAVEVKGIVIKHDGQSIYTGGDDVLAVLPVTQVIQCAVQIQKLFENKLNSLYQKLKRNSPSLKAPSVSIGVAIVHHLEPLQDVMQLLRDSEKIAKRKRNSLAVCLAKRSGTEITVTGEWDKFPGRIMKLSEMSLKKQIPSGYAYELRDMLLDVDIYHANRGDIQVLRNVVKSEEQRILKRKNTVDGVTVDVDTVTGLRNDIVIVDDNNNPITELELDEWINEIIVAREISMKKDGE
jgi:CRISPR-associated protein Cmr2